MYVCDSAVHKDKSGDLKAPTPASYKLDVYKFDENDMIGADPDTRLDMCESCFTLFFKGAVKPAPNVKVSTVKKP